MAKKAGGLVEARQGFQISTDDGALLYGEIARPVDAAGTVGGPAVVLCHCWTGRRSNWDRVIDRLTSAGHIVVSFDQRGHGSSSVGPDNRSMRRLSRDLGQVLDHVLPLIGDGSDDEAVVLAGHSMGGAVILQRLVDGDPRVAGVALVSTSGRFSHRLLRPGGRLLARLLGTKALARFHRSRAGRLVVRAMFGRHPDVAAIQATHNSLCSTNPAVVAEQMRAIISFDVVEQLRDVAVPTAVMVGRRDILTPLPHAKRLVRSIAGSKLVVLPKAGHMLPFERPTEISAEISELVEGAAPVCRSSAGLASAVEVS